jgi:phosphoribosylamine---glycine ligase
VDSLAQEDNAAVCTYARAQQVSLVVVGPEAPLVNGVADALTAVGIPCFGPSANAALIEGSKLFAKTLMSECGIPTARFGAFRCFASAQAHLNSDDVDYPVVVKAGGLAGGKGVLLPDTTDQALHALRSMLEVGCSVSVVLRLMVCVCVCVCVYVFVCVY